MSDKPQGFGAGRCDVCGRVNSWGCGHSGSQEWAARKHRATRTHQEKRCECYGHDYCDPRKCRLAGIQTPGYMPFHQHTEPSAEDIERENKRFSKKSGSKRSSRSSRRSGNATPGHRIRRMDGGPDQPDIIVLDRDLEDQVRALALKGRAAIAHGVLMRAGLTGREAVAWVSKIRAR